MPRYNHMCSLAFTIVSGEKDGSDITRGQFLQAVQKRLNALADDADVHEAILPPEDTYMETITQEEFRENPDKCVSCGSDSTFGSEWSCENDRVYQNRGCNACCATWTVTFTAQSFLRHDE